MTCREKVELKYFLQSRILLKKREGIGIENTLQTGRFLEYIKHTKQMKSKQCDVLDLNERQRKGIESFEIMEQDGIGYDRGVYDWEDNGQAEEFNLSKQDKLLNPKDELMMLDNKGSTTKEERSDIQNQEEAFNIEELETVVQKLELVTDQDALRKTSCFDERSNSKTVDPFTVVLTFKRGDKMKTIAPANNG